MPGVSVFMRAVMASWPDPPFSELVAFVAGREGGFTVVPINGRDWSEFEINDKHGQAVLAADITVGDEAREELAELAEELEDLDGSPAAQATVQSMLETASTVVGLQILMSRYDESVAAANLVIAFLERWPGVLTQVDSVGWYDGDRLILTEADK